MDILPEGAVMTLQEVEGLLRDLEKLEAKRKKLTEQVKEKRRRVIAYMDENQLTLFATDTWQASVTRSKSQRFDVAAFKADHARIYAKYLKATECERFTFGRV